jgi:hypothetical protein
MRNHCRTQHSFDPEPAARPPPERFEMGKSSVYPVELFTAYGPAKKFLKMMVNVERHQNRAMSVNNTEPVASPSTLQDALARLLDNYIIIRKREFHGITAYFCRKCLTFQYRYVKNIFDEKTAQEEHIHIPDMPYDPNRQAKELEGSILSHRLLMELTNSLFGSSKIVEVTPCIPSANYHGPVIKFNFLNPYDWPGVAIRRNGAVISDSYLNEFITHVKGTYAQIMVESGPLTGVYLMSVRSAG